MLDFLFDAEALMRFVWFLTAVFGLRLVAIVVRFRAGNVAAESDMRLSQHIMSQLSDSDRRRILESLPKE